MPFMFEKSLGEEMVYNLASLISLILDAKRNPKKYLFHILD